jgi:hypothetical protein
VWSFRTWKDIVVQALRADYHASVQALMEEHQEKAHQEVKRRIRLTLERRFMFSLHDQLMWAFRTWKDIMREGAHLSSVQAMKEEREKMLHEEVKRRVKAALERQFMSTVRDKINWAFQQWKSLMYEFMRLHHAQSLKLMQIEHETAAQERIRTKVREAIERQLRQSAKNGLALGFRAWREFCICDVLKAQLEKSFQEILARQKSDLNIEWEKLFETEQNLFHERELSMGTELKRLDMHYKGEIDKILEAMRKTENAAEVQLANITKKYKAKFHEALALQREMFEKEKSVLEESLRVNEEQIEESFEARLEIALNEKEVQCYEAFEEEKQRLIAVFNERLSFFPQSSLNTKTRNELERLVSPSETRKLDLTAVRHESQAERDLKFLNSLRNYDSTPTSTTPTNKILGRKSLDRSSTPQSYASRLLATQQRL